METNNFIKNMNKLPTELLDIIFSYIPNYYKIHLNKEYFKKYHYLLKNNIINNKTEDYIRDTIKRDNDFIFNQLFIENYNKWSKMYNYYYNSFEFYNYITFLCYFCEENGTSKCKNIIYNYLKINNIMKNPEKMRLISQVIT
jgi:hypothetical protein